MAPCTDLKSTALDWRHEIRWMATQLLIVRSETITATSRKPGISTQKSPPKSRLNPGQRMTGRLIQSASVILSTSNSPKEPPTTEPAATPMIGAQRRSFAGPLRVKLEMTTTVAAALRTAPREFWPSDAEDSISPITGITVMGINMITVPATVGVRMRWNNESRHERAIGTREDRTTSTASRAGPPAANASIQIDMYAADVPMTRRWPEPILPK